MEKQFGIRNLLAQHEVIPVVNITNVVQVENIIERLQSKSINCIELTLRSNCAIQAIETALKIYRSCSVGAWSSNRKIKRKCGIN